MSFAQVSPGMHVAGFSFGTRCADKIQPGNEGLLAQSTLIVGRRVLLGIVRHVRPGIHVSGIGASVTDESHPGNRGFLTQSIPSSINCSGFLVAGRRVDLKPS